MIGYIEGDIKQVDLDRCLLLVQQGCDFGFIAFIVSPSPDGLGVRSVVSLCLSLHAHIVVLNAG